MCVPLTMQLNEIELIDGVQQWGIVQHQVNDGRYARCCIRHILMPCLIRLLHTIDKH